MEFMKFIKLAINDENIINYIEKEYNNVIRKFDKNEYISKTIIFRCISNNEKDSNIRELYNLLKDMDANKLKMNKISTFITVDDKLYNIDKANEIVNLHYLNRDLHNKIKSIINKINISKNEIPIDNNIPKLIKERDIKIQYLNDIKDRLGTFDYDFICTAAYKLNIIKEPEMSCFKQVIPELYDELIKHIKPGNIAIRVKGGHIEGRINLINKVINDIKHKYDKIINNSIYGIYGDTIKPIEPKKSIIDPKTNKIILPEECIKLIEEYNNIVKIKETIKDNYSKTNTAFICIAAYQLKIISDSNIIKFKDIMPNLYNKLMSLARYAETIHPINIKLEDDDLQGRLDLLDDVINTIKEKIYIATFNKLITIDKDLYTILHENNALNSFIFNIVKCIYDSDLNKDTYFYIRSNTITNDSIYIEDMIACLFSWDDTNEGYEYWSKLNAKFNNSKIK